MEIKLRWEDKTGQYQNGSYGYLGKWRVMETVWDATYTEAFQEGCPWKPLLQLPGISSNKRFKTEDHAKRFCEHAVKYWLDNSGLIYKQMKTPRVRA